LLSDGSAAAYTHSRYQEMLRNFGQRTKIALSGARQR
jgi:hypothetical protein